MKKTVWILIVLVLAAALAATFIVPPITANQTPASPSFGAYRHVFIIGVDGAGRFFEEADTPAFDRIFADGAVSYGVRTEVPTDSGPNWASILTGVSYFKHKIHNGNSGEVQRTGETKYPSVFAAVRAAAPNAELASFCNWSNINFGVVETDLNVTETNIGNDAELTDAICAYFDAGNAPELFFVQLDSVDHAGHEYGSASDEYFEALEAADGYIGKIYDALARNGLLQDGLFLVTADHGHKKTGGHGRFSKRESTTTIAAAGKTVVPGGKPDGRTRNRDVAAIALFALGIDRPQAMSARIPANLFSETKGEARSFWKDMIDGIVSPVMWIVTQLMEG